MKSLLKRNLLFLLIIHVSVPVLVSAQEMLGYLNNSYAGFSSSQLNPANTVSTPYYLEVIPVTMHVFAENNYIFLAREDYRFSRFFEKNAVFPTHGPYNEVTYDRYTKTNKNGYVNARIVLPAASITLGKNAFGLYSAVRSAVSVNSLPFHMAKFMYAGFSFSPQWNTNYQVERNFSGAGIAWAETGLNYARMMRERGLDAYSGGITVKLLKGYAGAYVYGYDANYQVNTGDTLIVTKTNLDAGVSLPLDYDGNTYMQDPLFRGTGFAADLGISYQKKKRTTSDPDFTPLCSQVYVPYYYKIGLSLLDLGFIKFNRNAIAGSLTDGSTFWPGITRTQYTSVNSLIDTLNSRFNTRIVSGNSFTIGLPAALSLQADYNYSGNWYVSGTAVLPVRLMKSSVMRPYLLAIIPRYETLKFSVSLPITLYNWTQPRLGISARYRGFFIGTEKVGYLFSMSDFTGFDIYAGIKLSFRKGNCRGMNTDSCGNNEYFKFRTGRKK